MTAAAGGGAVRSGRPVCSVLGERSRVACRRMLWREQTARGYFLGQLPDDHVDEAWTKADEPAGDGGEIRFDAVLDEAEPHLDRLEANLDTDLEEHTAARVEERPSRATAVIEVEPDDAAPVASPPVRRTPRRGARARRRALGRRYRVAAVVTVVAVLIAGTGLYLRTQADAADKRARRPTSTSLERRSTPTTGTPTSVEVASGIEPAPASAGASGSEPSAPQGTSSSPSRGASPRAPASGSAAPAPGTSGAPPSNPESSPPRSPACQLLPVVCP